MQLKSEIVKFSKVMAAIVTTLGSVWFFGEPFLEDYVESHFDAYEIRNKQESSDKMKLRDLLGIKMGLPSDEVHIELGRMFKNETNVHETIDSDYIEAKNKRNKIIKEIKNIYPNTVLNYEN